MLRPDYTLIERKLDIDIPSGMIEFLNLTPGSSYNVKMYAVDANDNVTFREEYLTITDVDASVINEFEVYSSIAGHLKVDVNISDYSGGNVFSGAYLYWILDLNTKLNHYYIELMNGVGSVTFTDLDPERAYVIELLVRDSR